MKEIKFSEEKAKELFKRFKLHTILGNLSLSELFELLELARITQYEPSEYVIEQGAYDTELYILVSGCMEILYNEKRVGLIEKTGEIVGEMSLISKEVRSASIRAIDPVECLVINASHITENKAGPSNVLYYIFCHALAQRLKAVNEELAKLKGIAGS